MTTTREARSMNLNPPHYGRDGVASPKPKYSPGNFLDTHIDQKLVLRRVDWYESLVDVNTADPIAMTHTNWVPVLWAHNFKLSSRHFHGDILDLTGVFSTIDLMIPYQMLLQCLPNGWGWAHFDQKRQRTWRGMRV
ncbi:hypothetical protein CPB85DRAFT_1256623 [Mucidula mucida]|nr:hypothetical protein CPB85DRAFT_1256623 [Mucidula mucida]